MKFKKPTVKKCKGYWLVYSNKKQIFKCFSYSVAMFYYDFLLTH